MSNSEFKLPRKFTFDEYYALLKEYVKDPKAREYLAIYDEEYAAGCGELHETTCSELAHNAFYDFRGVGLSILAKNGWPTYREARELRKQPGLDGLTMMLSEFPRLARRLIRKEPESPFPDRDFDIDDPESMKQCLELWEKDSPEYQIYDLSEGE